MIDSAEDTPFINCNTAINRNDIISRSVTKIASFLSTDSSEREREIEARRLRLSINKTVK